MARLQVEIAHEQNAFGVFGISVVSKPMPILHQGIYLGRTLGLCIAVNDMQIACNECQTGIANAKARRIGLAGEAIGDVEIYHFAVDVLDGRGVPGNAYISLRPRPTA